MRSLMRSIGLAGMVLLALALAPGILFGQSAQPMDPLSALIALGGAVATSYVLSKVKGLDTAITSSGLFRKLQPVITLGGAFLAPWVAQKVGVSVDPSAFTAAPLATVVAVTSAELLSLLTKKLSPPAAPSQRWPGS